jgi:hypothetical protein
MSLVLLYEDDVIQHEYDRVWIEGPCKISSNLPLVLEFRTTSMGVARVTPDAFTRLAAKWLRLEGWVVIPREDFKVSVHAPILPESKQKVGGTQ